jgi:SAM-dependent methyltransferase
MPIPTRQAPIPLVQRVDYLLGRSRGQRVLHLGCTNAPYTEQAIADGSLLHLRLREVAKELHGVDVDRPGLERLAGLGCANLHAGDLGSLAGQLAAEPMFDLIIAGEIIEHLPDPGTFLSEARRVMGAGTTLVITTVNAYCGFRMAQYALRGRGGRAEPVHPDHVAYYSLTTLGRLVQLVGLETTGVLFYDLGREHVPYTRGALRWINRVATALTPQLADGIIVECRRPAEPPAGRP